MSSIHWVCTHLYICTEKLDQPLRQVITYHLSQVKAPRVCMCVNQNWCNWCLFPHGGKRWQTMANIKIYKDHQVLSVEAFGTLFGGFCLTSAQASMLQPQHMKHWVFVRSKDNAKCTWRIASIADHSMITLITDNVHLSAMFILISRYQ